MQISGKQTSEMTKLIRYSSLAKAHAPSAPVAVPIRPIIAAALVGAPVPGLIHGDCDFQDFAF